MPLLNYGESSSATNPVLDIYIRNSSGTLTNPATLEFAIYDPSNTQVYPATGRQAITIAPTPGGQLLSTGRFFAPFTAPANGPAGGYRIQWWFRATLGGQEITASQEFTVASPATSVTTSPTAKVELVGNINNLAVKGTRERISIQVYDASVSPSKLVNASVGPEVTVMNLGEQVLYRDRFPVFQLTGTVSVTAGQTAVTGTNTLFTTELRVGDALTIGSEAPIVDKILSNTQLILKTAHTAGASGATGSKATRIVNTGPGLYHLDWGDPSAVKGTTETATAGIQTFLWQASSSTGSEGSLLQNLCIASTMTLSFVPPFRDLIDKARLAVNDEDCFLGYTDAQLVQYLDQGLSIINAYEPYPVWGSIDQFPRQFQHVLLESSLLAGVMSQELFAISTDVPNFSDQGNSFVVQHQPQLAAVLNQITQRMDKMIPMMKLKYVNSGTLHIQAGNNFRLAQLLEASPSGALFRNLFFSS